ncbi:hypothetical protein DFH06DRAFT_1139028 [Mycena polygramma]|nr:hypothetical protein DFH06DRAFT_1139028 [Mycena polygramma]
MQTYEQNPRVRPLEVQKEVAEVYLRGTGEVEVSAFVPLPLPLGNHCQWFVLLVLLVLLLLRLLILVFYCTPSGSHRLVLLLLLLFFFDVRPCAFTTVLFFFFDVGFFIFILLGVSMSMFAGNAAFLFIGEFIYTNWFRVVVVGLDSTKVTSKEASRGFGGNSSSDPSRSAAAIEPMFWLNFEDAR